MNGDRLQFDLFVVHGNTVEWQLFDAPRMPHEPRNHVLNFRTTMKPEVVRERIENREIRGRLLTLRFTQSELPSQARAKQRFLTVLTDILLKNGSLVTVPKILDYLDMVNFFLHVSRQEYQAEGINATHVRILHDALRELTERLTASKLFDLPP